MDRSEFGLLKERHEGGDGTWIHSGSELREGKKKGGERVARVEALGTVDGHFLVRVGLDINDISLRVDVIEDLDALHSQVLDRITGEAYEHRHDAAFTVHLQHDMRGSHGAKNAVASGAEPAFLWPRRNG